MSTQGTLAPSAKFTGLDDEGNPLVGGFLYTYSAGTMTPQPTYTDQDLQVPNSNPIELDAGGRATVYLLQTSYRFVLTDADGNVVWTQDDVTSGAIGSASGVGFYFDGDPTSPVTDHDYPAGITVNKLHAGTATMYVDSGALIGTYVIEAMLMATDGASVTAALVNLDDHNPDTPIATVSSMSTTGARVQSGAITFAEPGTAKNYGIKVKVTGAGAGFVWGVRLIKTGATGNASDLEFPSGGAAPVPPPVLEPHHVTHEPGGNDALQLTGESQLFGRGEGAGGGEIQEITLGPNLLMVGTELDAPAIGTVPFIVQSAEGLPPDSPAQDLSLLAPGFLTIGEGGVISSTTEGGGGGGSTDLEYLGPYVDNTYNDGDIVIGADGIAYMCVKSGVTTPPEPWPGVGMISAQGPPGPAGPQGPRGEDAAIDATYWVSTAHATLSAERNFGALPSGYVKSIVTGATSNPTTVTTIPVTDGGTGASSASAARTNLGIGTMGVQNADAVAITGGTIRASDIQSTGNINATGGIAGAYIVGDGSNLTNLNASQLTWGTVAPARMGSGTANTGTFLRGDGTWAPVPPTPFPSGLIVLSTVPCPVGWTRITAWDGYFMRIGASPGSGGGTWSHSHGPGSYAAADHTHAAGSLQVNSHNHSSRTHDAGSHSHGVSIGFSGRTNDNNQSVDVQRLTNSAWNVATNSHGHDFSGAVNGNTGDAGSHWHGIDNDAPSLFGNTGVAGASGLTGSSTDVQHIPPYIEFYLCQKS